MLWGFVALLCVLVAGVIVVGASYIGWNSGVATARANATGTAQVESQLQCQLIPQDLAEGKLQLAQRRLEELRKQTAPPDCLGILAPTATAVFEQSLPSRTPQPTATSIQVQATAAPTIAPTVGTVSSEGSIDYDLDALLAEAQSDIGLRDYPSAIDTLEAIISIDTNFNRELVRRLYLEALTAQALLLFRSGKLSEAIVLADRAEEYGSIEDLYHERFIALEYLDGQRYKVTNPAEAVRKFSRIYYEFGVQEYVHGPMANELQEALQNYADALALQGDPCPAQAEYEAALNLPVASSRINLGVLSAKRDQAIQACAEQQLTLTLTPGAVSEVAPAGIGVRVEASQEPVGESE